MRVQHLAVAFGLAAAVALGAWPAQAQQPPASDAAAQVERQQTQPGNNAPVWREIRSGQPGYTTVQGVETGVLVESRGQTYREARVPIAFWGGVLVAVSLAGLALFYLIRGPLDGTASGGGRMIRRFSTADRYAHWLMAITWVVLAITGLIMSLGKDVLLPVIGYTLFSWLAVLSKNLHNFAGPILIVAVPWMFIQYIRDNGIGAEDFKWFMNIFGYFRGHEYPSHRFNAGEKLVFWVVLVILTTILVVTGLILNFPNFGQTRATMQNANLIHMIASYLAIALAAVHIYLGTIGVKGAYRAMRDGYVTEAWAEHHHERWYEDVKAGKARQKFAEPGEAAGGAGSAPARTQTS
ncbi:MAG: formate dehydrogenase subunit gamma [Burkholderiales bacterium]|nr:formate dehydrogenase subunit gamma [Burkholderiales bacterium]